MQQQLRTEKAPRTATTLEEQTFNCFDTNQYMKMVTNMLSITSTQLKIFGEIFETEGREFEKTMIPMQNVCDIAPSAPPYQTNAVFLQTMQEATITYLTNLKNLQDANNFFSQQAGKALLNGVPPAFSGTKTAHKRLPNGNKVIDGLTLQRVISDVDETVLPPTSQYCQSIKRTFKYVQQGKTG